MPKSSTEAAIALPERTRRRWTREDARAIVAAYENSGLSLKLFAAREGLKPERVARWKRNLRSGKPSSAPSFVELRAINTKGRSSTRVEIVLRSGHVLFVSESADANSLRRIVDLLDRDTEC